MNLNKLKKKKLCTPYYAKKRNNRKCDLKKNKYLQVDKILV